VLEKQGETAREGLVTFSARQADKSARQADKSARQADKCDKRELPETR
jgi:hypothetical protein